MKKDISPNLYQKSSILCSKILLNVFHNMKATALLLWQHTGFQTSPKLKAFLATFGVPFWYVQMMPHMLDPEAYKDVSSRLWPHLIFCELKITDILKSSEWGLEKSELPWEHNFYSRKCVSCRTSGLPSFIGLRCKLTKISLFIYLL